MVASCPPWGFWAEVIALTTLLTVCPFAQIGPRVSMKALIWEVATPNLVGVLKIMASAQTISSGVASGMCAVASAWAFQAGTDSTTDWGAVSLTFNNLTSAPSCSPASAAFFANW